MYMSTIHRRDAKVNLGLLGLSSPVAIVLSGAIKGIRFMVISDIRAITSSFHSRHRYRGGLGTGLLGRRRTPTKRRYHMHPISVYPIDRTCVYVCYSGYYISLSVFMCDRERG